MPRSVRHHVWIIAALLVIALVLQVKLWRGTGGIADVQRLEDRIGAQQHKNEQLQQRNESLAVDTRDLQTGLEGIEERARAELGLVKADEEFYRVITPASTAESEPKTTIQPDRKSEKQ